jgi:hypothetical protein
MGLVERARHLLDSSAEPAGDGAPERLVELVTLARELEAFERSARARAEYAAELAGRAAAEIGSWERSAAEAVLAGREDVARSALRRKREAEIRRDKLRAEAERREAEIVEIESLGDEISEAVLRLRPRLGARASGASARPPEPPRSAEIEAELRRLRERALAGRREPERPEQ